MILKKHPHRIPVLDYNKITDYIYIGTNHCCVKHFNEKLLKKGIKADISLEFTKVDAPFGISYYSWLPTKNHTSPSFKQLHLGTEIIGNLIENNVKIYIHCKNGHGRAPTLVSAYLISQGKNYKEAIAFVKNKRPSMHLDKNQVNALKKFEKRIKK